MAESKELKPLLMKVKKESEKVGLKLKIQNTKIMASGHITKIFKIFKKASAFFITQLPALHSYLFPLTLIIIEHKSVVYKFIYCFSLPAFQSMANRWRNNGNSDRLYFLRLQNHCRW